MKCNCILTRTERRNASGTSMVMNRNKTASWWQTSDKGPFPGQSETWDGLLSAPNTSICGGTIKVSIVAEDEPYMGGSSAVLAINYECNECGWTFYPHLPQTKEALDKLLCEVVDNMDFELATLKAREAEMAERERKDNWLREAEQHAQTRRAEEALRRAEKAAAKTAKGVATRPPTE